MRLIMARPIPVSSNSSNVCRNWNTPCSLSAYCMANPTTEAGAVRRLNDPLLTIPSGNMFAPSYCLFHGPAFQIENVHIHIAPLLGFSLESCNPRQRHTCRYCIPCGGEQSCSGDIGDLATFDISCFLLPLSRLIAMYPLNQLSSPDLAMPLESYSGDFVV
jgi:hypothetical protein